MSNQNIVVLGSGGVGKSAITIQLINGVFIEKYDPTIEDSYQVSIEYEDEMYRTQILDTAGTEQFKAMRDLYLKSADGFVFVFSLTAKSTFLQLFDLIEQAKRVKDSDNIPMVIVGNKSDLVHERAITSSQAEALAHKVGAVYFETSAKTCEGINEIFTSVTGQIVEERNKSNSNKKNNKKSKNKLKMCSIM
eukprot:TRINITY_DN1651_c0_g1_i1.p1 TRINITY_DN1651_c0_g1~~TRINITY_DN1651_c0_g1_i1.p1  ORF type:complete len:192 (+),score=48.87 TRINITY_DN1651_c0_g1_i1:126-701(+)